MAWEEPKIDWESTDVPLPEDFKRIEGNEKELKTTTDELSKPFTWGRLKGS